MTTTTEAPAFRYLGVTDDCVECQKCGKTQLRSTVVLAILDADGNTEDVTYYGSTCAARALKIPGGGRSVLQSARWAHEKLITEAAFARKQLKFYGLPEVGDPDHDTLRQAVRLYVRSNRNVSKLVEETGRKVPEHVMDMLRRNQKTLAEAAIVGIVTTASVPRDQLRLGDVMVVTLIPSGETIEMTMTAEALRLCQQDAGRAVIRPRRELRW